MDYFEAAGIHVLEGRSFSHHDDKDGQPVAIVSRTFADRHWPGVSAVGKLVRIVQTPPSPELEIVGVVSDVKQFTLDAPSTADLYVPLPQMPAFQAPLMAARMYWVIKVRGGEPAAQAIRDALAQVDPGVAASNPRTLESVWLASLGSHRANVRLLQVFGNVALALCAIGVYGVTAFAARSSRRELAIRSALGGSRLVLTVAMLRRELPPVILGVTAGVFVALIGAPLWFDGVFQVGPRDLTTYVEVGIVLLIIAMLSAYVPIRRAGAVNPAEALQD
jgi:putative ABC transport system permease protein